MNIKKIIAILISIAFIYGILNIPTINAQEKTIEVYGWVRDELENIVKDVEVLIRARSSLEEVITFSKDGYYKFIIRIKEDEPFIYVKAEYKDLEQPEITVLIDPSKSSFAFDIKIEGLFIGYKTITESFSPTTSITITLPTMTVYWVGTRTRTTTINGKEKIVEEFISITNNKGTTITEKIIDVEELKKTQLTSSLVLIVSAILILFFLCLGIVIGKTMRKKSVKKQQRKITKESEDYLKKKGKVKNE